MNWDDLRVFLAVAREESLSRAGRVLRVDPATVGRRIARLEESVGITLFAKSPTGYALSNDGQRFLSHAEQMEQSLTLGVEEAVGQTSELSGQIRLGAPDGAANFLLPQVCARIVEANPDLDIQLVALPRMFNLTRREADLALAVSAPTAERLLVQKVTDYHLHLAASQDYLRKYSPITHLRDLGRHRMVGYIQDMIFDKELDYLDEAGVEKVTFASNSVSVQAQWVKQGHGIGIVHDFTLPSLPGVQRILTDQLSLKRSFYLVRHVDDRRLERMNRFTAALADGLKSEVTRLERMT